MDTPRYSCRAGDIKDDAGRKLTLCELKWLADQHFKDAMSMTNRDCVRDQMLAARSAFAALQASIEWALCSDGAVRVSPTEDALARSLKLIDLEKVA